MVKKLISQVKEYKKASILTPIFVILETALEVLIPILMAQIIDTGVANGDIKYVCKIALVMVVLVGLSLSCGIMGGVYGSKASTGFAKNLRQAMYYNIQNFSFSNIDRFSTAGLITRLTTDVTNVQNSFQVILRMFVKSPIMLIFSMIMTFSISPKLSLIFLGAIIFLGIILSVIIKFAFPAFDKVFKKYDDLNASVQENINGIRVVKAYVREEHEINKFHKASQKVYDYFVKAENLVIMNMPAMQLTVYTCILLISWFGAKMVVSDTLKTGELMSMFTYMMFILVSLMMMSMSFVMVTLSVASAKRIVEVLDEESDLLNCENPIKDIMDGSISFENVNFSYSNDKNKLALKSVNININSGETIGVIGGTGSSKSSLVQLIPRLYDTTEGCVKVGGVNVKEYDIESLRNEVAMVLQKNVLFSGTIKENLRWGNKEASDEELIRVCKLSQADDFIQAMPNKYDTHIEQGGSNVSGGQKQRLCIARALLKKPKILILDDSTSAVDTKTDALIRKAFREEIPNTTKIIIAQRISSIEDADKVIVLNDGIVDAFDTPAELLKTNKIYQEVYNSQMKGAEE